LTSSPARRHYDPVISSSSQDADGPIRAVDTIRHGLAPVAERAHVAVEEPLEIRLDGIPLAVTMRTPGDDDDLALGFLLTEAILLSPRELDRLDHSGQPGDSRLDVRPAAGVTLDRSRLQRTQFVSSSCGICGKTSIESVRLFARVPPAFTLPLDAVRRFTATLRARQPAFDRTGGLHAAGVLRPDGTVLAVREDVGRHNAVDKAIGAAARLQWPLPPAVLVVSGRQSFEIVQKAAIAGLGGVVGVSAPSSLAVDLAREMGMLLAGFARADEFRLYAGADRVTAP
jgi:FdhD protein